MRAAESRDAAAAAATAASRHKAQRFSNESLRARKLVCPEARAMADRVSLQEE